LQSLQSLNPGAVGVEEEQMESHKQLEVDGPHKNAYVAIRDAFKAMRRQLQDYVHCLRHEVKTHHPNLNLASLRCPKEPVQSALEIQQKRESSRSSPAFS
jgi:23S rRNA maturation-related 3'-5' exoribonuclease YhaM